ncbi:hypothetical protein BGX28_007645 [Mortierella sp. GBA30]|nr:hypothetical protein BGX28_007645 [Mortierella sp. GBA30]
MVFTSSLHFRSYILSLGDTRFPTMASSIRQASMALPRVSMARVPLVAFANCHITPINHANSSHPSAFSSMPPQNGRKSSSNTGSSSSSWSNSAKETASKLEQSAKKMAKEINENKKDYLREVKQYDSPEDEVMMELGLAMSKSKGKDKIDASKYVHHHNYSGGKGDVQTQKDDVTTFEDTLVDQVKEDIRPTKIKSDHQQEMVSSLSDELKADRRASSSLSQHASDAIRMVESHSILKHDKAPIHAVRDEDPSQKTMDKHK